VSRADREAEATCRAEISRTFPGDGWIGEETGEEPGTTSYRWIVDPIDGTRNFLRGIPLWSTLVACEEERDGQRRVVAAAAAFPGLGELYEASLGDGAYCNGVQLRVSAAIDLRSALFCYETPGWFQRQGLSGLFEALCQRSALQRGGGDAYFHMLVASGRAEVVVEPSLSLWDVAATSLIVSEAGGTFSDLAGRPDIRSGNAVVSNGAVHDEVLDLIRRHPAQPAERRP
jgi:histidinol-phosphatase